MPNRYPQEAVTRDGRRLLIRPMTAADGDGLYDFFLRLPEDSRRFAWNRIEDRATTDRWCRDLDYSRILPLLAFDRSEVVAAVSLHHREKGPLRLVGRISWLLEPRFRGVGLGILLINHFIGIARDRGLRFLTCMLISDLEAEAIQVLTDLGFKAFFFPGYGVDPDGDPHDMTKMILEL